MNAFDLRSLRNSSISYQTVSIQAFAASCLALAVLFDSAQAADGIKLLPDRTEKGAAKQFNGQITSESPTEVKIKTTAGKEETIPVSSIDTVTYDSLPPSFLRAESRLNAGAIAEAADLYGTAVTEAKGKVPIERAAMYGRAHALMELALVDQSKANDAASALEAFAKAHPTSRQIAPALTSLVQLRLSQGDLPKAEKAVADLKAKLKYPPELAKALDLAPVFEARILSKKGNNDDALKVLEGLLTTATQGSPASRAALLAKAECLAALKKFPEAEAAIKDVIAQAPPEDQAIQAEAYNTLGDCLKAAGRPKDALMAYLKTDILYDGSKDQHALALFQIVDLWRTLKQDGRANDVQERLRQTYPQSPYAKSKPATR